MREQSTPTLGAVINDGIRRRLDRVRVALPARVLAYDATSCKAQVQPAIYESYEDEAGDRQYESAPVINDVPVVMPGSGGVRIKFPIAVGDTVLLVFASSNIDRWLALGGEQPPGDTRRHDLADAIAIPGLQSLADASDNSPMIEFTATGQIHAGGSTALPTLADINALKTAITAALTSASIAVGAGGAAAVATAINAALTAWPTGTTILKGG